MKARPAISAVSHLGLCVDFRLSIAGDKTLMKHKAYHDPHRKCAATEAERVDLVAGLVIHTQEFVDVEDVALEAPTKGAAQYSQGLKRRCADAVIVEGDLVRSQSYGACKPPPILTGYRAISSSLRQYRKPIPTRGGPQVALLVRGPAARSSLGLRDVPDVGDRRPAFTQRRWHAPAHQDELAFGTGVAHNRRRIIRKHAGHWRQVAA